MAKNKHRKSTRAKPDREFAITIRMWIDGPEFNSAHLNHTVQRWFHNNQDELEAEVSDECGDGVTSVLTIFDEISQRVKP